MSKNIFLTLIGFSLSACALFPSVPEKKPVVDTRRARLHQQAVKNSEMKRIDRKISELRQRDLKSNNEVIRRALPRPLNADTLYAEIIKSYRIQNLAAVEFYKNELIKRYPNSIHIDNAIYLTGTLFFKKNDYAQSLKFFQQIITHYSGSNKRPAALLMKARAYSALNLKDLAIKTLKYLRKEYPGSPEFFQADAELSIIQKT